MTTIVLDPIARQRPEFARLTVTLVHGTFSDARSFTFYYGAVPVIDLAPPAINNAFIFTLTINGNVTIRTVTFSGDTAHWDDLTDVDPTTLQPLPVDAALTAWQAVRDQIINAIDIPDPDLIFENHLI